MTALSSFKTLRTYALQGIDATYDAVGSLARVLMRGAFAADRKSYRSRRFAPLSSSDVLIQHIDLNAADEREAMRIVRTDPDRYLPFPLDQALVDIAGPLLQAEEQASPTNRFRVGLLPVERASSWRAEHKPKPFAAIEGFVVRFEDGVRPLAFHDAFGVARRRERRGLLAIALVAFAWAATDLYTNWTAAVEARSAAHAQTLMRLEHRIRRAEKEAAQAEAAKALLSEDGLVDLGETIEALDRIAARLPRTSAIGEIMASGDGLTFSARSYEPAEFELQLRRAFEHRAIDFARSGSGRLEDVSATVRAADAPYTASAP